jgi:hypothetical protein
VAGLSPRHFEILNFLTNELLDQLNQVDQVASFAAIQSLAA